jgi:hypothetical protein
MGIVTFAPLKLHYFEYFDNISSVDSTLTAALRQINPDAKASTRRPARLC